jgi:threonine/homoserine/homoserine lactone efflux protein
MLITLLLPAILLACLVLLAAGIAVLLKAKNKLTGWISVVFGLVLALFSCAIFLVFSITTSVQVASGK